MNDDKPLAISNVRVTQKGTTFELAPCTITDFEERLAPGSRIRVTLDCVVRTLDEKPKSGPVWRVSADELLDIDLLSC